MHNMNKIFRILLAKVDAKPNQLHPKNTFTRQPTKIQSIHAKI